MTVVHLLRTILTPGIPLTLFITTRIGCLRRNTYRYIPSEFAGSREIISSKINLFTVIEEIYKNTVLARLVAGMRLNAGLELTPDI